MHYIKYKALFLPFYIKGCNYKCCALLCLFIFHIMYLEALSISIQNRATSFLFVATQYSTVWVYHDFFNQLLQYKLLGCFQSFATRP